MEKVNGDDLPSDNPDLNLLPESDVDDDESSTLSWPTYTPTAALQPSSSTSNLTNVDLSLTVGVDWRSPTNAPPQGESTLAAAATVRPSSSAPLPARVNFPDLQLSTASQPENRAAPAPRHRGERRNPTRTPPEGKSATIPPPYPWSDVHRATIRSLSYLHENRIASISGEVRCKKCDQKFTMEFDLEQKFGEITAFVAANRDGMHQRAPDQWKSPILPKCGLCNQENSVAPVMAAKKREINWLFLLLGQMVGCCSLDQLKYFCKHTKNHRTGAKDRLTFLAYMSLCKQLDPDGPYGI